MDQFFKFKNLIYIIFEIRKLSTEKMLEAAAEVLNISQYSR